MKKSKKINLKNIKKLSLKNRKIILKIIILIIMIIIILLSLLSIRFMDNNKSDFPKPTEERAKELLYNSYIYYILSSGNVPLNGYELLLDEDKYYGIDVDVHSLAEIETILKDTFSETNYDDLYINIYGDSEKIFTEEKNRIYISKVTPDDNCKNIKLSKDVKITEDSQGNFYVEYSSKDKKFVSTQRIVYENSRWVLINPIPVCYTETIE